MKKLLLALVSFALACNHSADTKPEAADTIPQDGTQLNDTSGVSDTLSSDTIRPLSMPVSGGIYRATLPGIEHTVAFYPDQTFRMQERKLSGQSSPVLIEGSWSSGNGFLLLHKENNTAGRYRQADSKLLLIRGEKEYRLQKLPSAYDNDHWRKLIESGTEFFGLGNEPFWNIEIDEEKAIVFHRAEWEKPRSFKPSHPLVAGDSTVYQTANDSVRLHIVIYKTFCSDGMSDFIYDQAVEVRYNNQTFSGCGLLFKKFAVSH